MKSFPSALPFSCLKFSSTCPTTNNIDMFVSKRPLPIVSERTMAIFTLHTHAHSYGDNCHVQSPFMRMLVECSIQVRYLTQIYTWTHASVGTMISIGILCILYWRILPRGINEEIIFLLRIHKRYLFNLSMITEQRQ